jgi:Xaa-Pro aminopeptidase
MRRILLLCLCALAAYTAQGADTIARSEFRERRAALRKSLDGTMVLFARTEGPDELFGFIQEPNFYYLTGWNLPGAILLITPTTEKLFLPRHDEHRERYAGRRPSAIDAGIQELTGFDEVLPPEKFEAEFDKALNSYENVYLLGGATPDHLRARYPLREFSSAAPQVARLRMKKSPAEIAAIQRATDVTVEGHLAAWKRMSSGLYEYQIGATVTNVFMEDGCDRHAYAPIIGSGPNSVVLHYSANRRRMDRGDVVVMDMAAECSEYASDVTRTVPVSGKFSPRQRELYEIVLGAQKAAIAAIKPGIRLTGEENSLNKIAKDYINSHGKDLHGEPLGKYFIHGLGHQVGLEVHDATAPGPLEAGMVITIEPGIYIPEEGIGIRIEDTVLVTEQGAKVLSAALPKEPDEIEKALAR